MQQRITFKNSLGYTLVGVLHTPDKKQEHPAGVIVCHGLTINKDKLLISTIADNLERSNFLVFRFDLTGHGESQGEFTEATYSQWTDDIKKGIDYLYKMGLRRIGLVGHSQSGACIILTAAEDSRVNSIIPIAPVAYPKRLIQKRFNSEEIEKVMVHNEIVMYKGEFPLRKNFFEDLDKQDVIEASKMIHGPTLIIHGSEDKTIVPRESLDIFNNLGSDEKIKKRVIIEGANHAFNKYDEKLLRRVSSLTINWFQKYLKRESEVVQVWVKFGKKILLLKRSEKLKNYPGLWNTVAGFLDEDNKVEEQALIELQEETEISKDQVKLVKIGEMYEMEDEDLDKLWQIHPLLFESSTDHINLDWEHTEYQWIKPENLKNFEVVPKLEIGLKKIL